MARGVPLVKANRLLFVRPRPARRPPVIVLVAVLVLLTGGR